MSESKELGCKWNFQTRSLSSMGHSREDSSFEHFVHNKLRCLVREYVQNSMDAQSTKYPDKIVEVHFTLDKIRCADYPELIGSLRERFVACSEYCKAHDNSKDPYTSKVEYLDEHQDSEIGFLKVSDYNTHGMTFIDDLYAASGFKSCVRESSASFKKDRKAGGSHGLGKTVGFVNSRINTVYYSTMDEEGNTYGEGVIKLCDHIIKDADGTPRQYESAAFYDSCNGEKPNIGNSIPEIFRRLVPGTDAYVIGIELTEDDIITMKKEAIRGFFKAIHDEKVVIVINGERIDKSSIGELLHKYFNDAEYGELDKLRTAEPWLHFNPRPYYDEVLLNTGQDEDHVSLNTNIDFPGQFPFLGDATLMIWKSEKITENRSRDSIVFMRDNAMVIEVNRGRGNKGYYGICICDGEGSEYLRMIETATHDKWNLDEISEAPKEDKKKATKTLNELKDFVKACEAKVFPEILDQEEEIKSLKRHRLGLTDKSKDPNQEEAAWPGTNITENTTQKKRSEGSISILSTTKGGKKKKKRKGQESTPLPPAPAGGKDNPTPPNPDPDTRTPEEPSGKKPEISGVENEGEGNFSGSTYEDTPTGKHMKEIKLAGNCRRLIPLHDGEFACKLAITVPTDYENCKLALFIQGIAGKFPLELKRASNGYRIEGVNRNEISGFDLSKDGVNIIKFTPIESIKNYSLIIEAYGH